MVYMLHILEQQYAGLKSTYRCGTEEIGLTSALGRRMKKKYTCVAHKSTDQIRTACISLQMCADPDFPRYIAHRLCYVVIKFSTCRCVVPRESMPADQSAQQVHDRKKLIKMHKAMSEELIKSMQKAAVLWFLKCRVRLLDFLDPLRV